MRNTTSRKTPRFFIINPISDRRLECRFESEERVLVRFQPSGVELPAIAFDMGKKGLRLQSSVSLDCGASVEIQFSNIADNIRCYGRVAWSKPTEGSGQFLCGVEVQEWHGIVQGKESWKIFKGFRPKRDRRRKLR